MAARWLRLLDRVRGQREHRVSGGLSMKLSRRTDWPREPSRLSKAIAAARREGTNLVDLTESNPTRCGFLDRAHDVALLGDARGVRYDPAPFGRDEARDAVVSYYADRKRDI